MKLVSFATATALSLLVATGAIADDNFSNVLQQGNDNAGSVTQGGGNGNDVGTLGLSASQIGNQNLLTFVQSGSGNAIGAEGSGFLQTSNRNSATITQASDGNAVRQVIQTGIALGTGGVDLRRNTLNIDQNGGNGNIVARVTQIRAPGLLGAPGQAGNVATITQTGAGGGNIVGSLSGVAGGLTQDGRGHQATITQTGGGNVLANLVQSDIGQRAIAAQTGSDNVIGHIEQSGLNNRLTITQNGTGNGAAGFDPGSRTGGWGTLVQGHAYQSGGLLGGNVLDYEAIGDDNSFGFNQSGSNNDAIGDVGGSGNQTGIIQAGQSNWARFNVSGGENQVFIHQGLAFINIANAADILITGDGNHVGAVQSGTNNNALATIANGNGNTITIDQESVLLGNEAVVAITNGSDNVVSIVQSHSNRANVGITGNNNHLAASQSGFNTLQMTINGNDNNAPALGGFSGAALIKATPVGLTPGAIFQNGFGNSITYSVGNLYASNANQFAFYQNGDSNVINGRTNGHANQVVIVQQGNLNHAWFSQTGIGNIIGVSQ